MSAQAIQALTRFAAETWPGEPSQQQHKDWEALQPSLLPAALDWILPSGRHCAREEASLIEKADAVSAALNLYRWLLLKEQNTGSDLTGVRPCPAACCSLLRNARMYLETHVHLLWKPPEVRRHYRKHNGFLHNCVVHCLQVLDSGCLDEVRRSGLLPLQALANRSLQEVQKQAVAAEAVPDQLLAVQRVLEVLSRVLEVVDDIH